MTSWRRTDHEGIPVSFTHEIHQNPASPTGALVASVYGVDVEEMGDGYSSGDLRRIAEELNLLATLLDHHNISRNTPMLDSHIQVSDQSVS